MVYTVSDVEREFRRTFGRVVKHNRNLIGYTQVQLADLIGTTQRHISDIEIGVYAPSLLLYAKLCIALEMQPSQVTDMLRLIKFSELYPKGTVKKGKY